MGGFVRDRARFQCSPTARCRPVSYKRSASCLQHPALRPAQRSVRTGHRGHTGPCTGRCGDIARPSRSRARANPQHST
jgi:hypothetical protein